MVQIKNIHGEVIYTLPEGEELYQAVLVGLDLHEADLRGADLSLADLEWADLSGADLTDADLSSASIALRIITTVLAFYFDLRLTQAFC